MYKTILVPLDGSKRAETILPHVEQLARQNNARIVFLEILEPNAAMVTPYDMVPYIDVEQGPVVRTILDIADRESADIVAMASHGRTGLARVFYGSVAAGVLAAADRPLLIVRAEKIS